MQMDGLRGGHSVPSTAEVDDFLSKVSTVNQQVKDLLNGNLTLEELEAMEGAEEKKERILKEMKAEEERRRLLQGAPGKGHRQGYKLFCKRCHLEFQTDEIKQCSRCQQGDQLMTYEVSRFEILECSAINPRFCSGAVC